MKAFIIIVLWIAFVLGWAIARNNSSTKTDSDLTQTSTQSGTPDAPWMSGAITVDPVQKAKIIEEEKKLFLSFLQSLEDNYLEPGTALTWERFSSYLEEVVTYIYAHPDIFNIATLPFKDFDDNIKIIKDQIWKGTTNNKAEVTILIDHINTIGGIPKQFTKVECKAFLEKQEDIWWFLRDPSNLTYSKYRNSPFFQRELEESDRALLDKGSNAQKNPDSTESQLNQRMISDILFFSQVEEMSLSGIADAITCEFSPAADKPMCENLKTALKTWDKEFILKKFSDNERIYDLDSFYIRYLIWDLTKPQLIDKLCLIQ